MSTYPVFVGRDNIVAEFGIVGDRPETVARDGPIVRWGLSSTLRTRRADPNSGLPVPLELSVFDGRLFFTGTGGGKIQVRPLFVDQPPLVLRVHEEHRPVEPVDENVKLEFDVPFQRIAEIEEGRCTIGGGRDLAYEIVGRTKVVLGKGIFWGTWKIDRRIPESDWLALLRSLRFCDGITVEFPAASILDPSKFGPVVAKYRHAQELQMGGHHGNAVGECREALDQLTRVLFNMDFDDQSIERLFAPMKAARPEQFDHLSKTLVAFRRLCNLGHHSRNPALAFEPFEARFALELTGCVLNLVARTYK